MIDQLISTYQIVALVIFVYMSLWFAVALLIKRNDVADVAWGIGFIVAAVSGYVYNMPSSAAAIAVVYLVAIWGIRLSWHIAKRNTKKPEDYRYKAWRDSWGEWFYVRSFLQVFMLQGLFLLIIASPIMVINSFSYGSKGIWLVLGLLVWCFGFAFESIADKQLKEFIAKPKNKGKIMDEGLWQYSRHPNYFGEVTQWWGIGVIALGASAFGWVGLIGPAMITFLILKVSGVPMLEKKYDDNKAYQKYKKRTSKFFPLPPITK